MIILPHHKYQINQCIVNCHDLTISVTHKSVTLPAKVFEFLKLLILHSETIVTKEQAIENIWLGNVEVGKRGAGNAIWHLRKSFTELGIDPEIILKTITKVGYQLIAKPIAIDVIQDETQELKSVFRKKSTLLVVFFIVFFAAILYIIILKMMNTIPSNTLNRNTVAPLKITNFEGVEEQPAISKDGQYMAFQWRRAKKNSQVFIKDISFPNAELRQISMTNDHDVSPSWSPDSQSLAYFRRDKLGGCSLHIRELISNTDQIIANDCISTGFLQGLDWSPDGNKIAYAQNTLDRVSIVVYDFSDKTFRPYSFPKAGEKDYIMKWAKDSKELIFARSSDLKASIYTVNELGIQQPLVESEEMVIGLAWDYTNNALYYNSMKEGAFVISKYNVDDKSIKEFYRGSGVGAISVDEQSNLLYFSQHIAQEYIAIHSLDSGKLIKQLASSSRDLYGQYVANGDAMIFLSNRTGAWELWLKDESESKQLTYNQGKIGLPAASPIESSFVIPIKQPNTDKFVMFHGTTQEGIKKPLFEIDGDVRNPSYSRDGQSLLFSSNASGVWGIYRYNFSNFSIETINSDQGKFAIESPDGGIYFSKEDVDGIFYLSNDGVSQHQITKNLNSKDWGSFFYLNHELHYLKRNNEFDKIVRLDNSGNEHDVMTFPIFSIRNNRAFSIKDNTKIAISMQGISGADIYSVPLH